MADGVLPVPPPVVSRVFQVLSTCGDSRASASGAALTSLAGQCVLQQELSRGIVNLQNARKIADFPFPFPYHQADTSTPQA